MGRGGRQPSPNPNPQYQRRSPAIPTTPTSAPTSFGAAPDQLENEHDPQDPRRPRPLYMSNPFVKAALVKGNFKTIVAQPRYCDLNEVRFRCDYNPFQLTIFDLSGLP